MLEPPSKSRCSASPMKGDDNMPQCKGCGAHIEYVKTPKGRSVPVDPEYVMIDTGAKKPDTIIITNKGEYVKGREIARGDSIVGSIPGGCYAIGRVAHFATCPKANQFRKKR